MAAVAPAIAGKRRILLVDDIELNRILTGAVLRGATYEVDCVDSGRSALDALADKTYDLVLLDLEMPGLGGHEAASAINRRQAAGMKLAALSSRNSSTDRDRSAEVGMSAHIARPVAPHELLRQIERVFCQPDQAAVASAWDRKPYEDWAARLGTERMHGFLVTLLDQFRSLLTLMMDSDDCDDDALHRAAHDLASTGGMLGFLEITRCCRTLLEAEDCDRAAARPALTEALQNAITCLDAHLSAEARRAAAAA